MRHFIKISIPMLFVTVALLAIGLFFETSSVKAEVQRTFSIEGKGDVDAIAASHYVYQHSPYEPTGLYIKANETVNIYVDGTQKITSYIGTYSYDREVEESWVLQPGDNTISSPNGGLLYFNNKNESGFIKVTVNEGGSPIPYFQLNKTTVAEWEQMLVEYPDSYAVELKSDRALITVTYADAKKFLGGKDPAVLLKKYDEAIRISDDFSGLSVKNTAPNKLDKHYIHFVEVDMSAWMFATSYRTGYSHAAVQYLLDVDSFTKEAWGVWHEQGHVRQMNRWNWSGLAEVTNNLFTLQIQTKFGNQSALETSDIYSKVATYLNQPTRDYNAETDPLLKVAMFWQLKLAYGESFYPELHKIYRDMGDSGISYYATDAQKIEMFITVSSRVAKQNLIPFYEKWGLIVTPETRQKVEALGLPLLTEPIWESTDSKPVIPKIALYKSINHVKIDLNSKDIYVGYNNEDFASEHTGAFVNDNYLFDNQFGGYHYSYIRSTDFGRLLNNSYANLKVGDVITLRQFNNRSTPEEVGRITVTNEINEIYVNKKTIYVGYNQAYFTKSHFAIFVNDGYLMENDHGVCYYAYVAGKDYGTVARNYKQNLKVGDVITIKQLDGQSNPEVARMIVTQAMIQ